MDRLQYEIFYRLWRIWHIGLRKFFDGFTETFYGKLGQMVLPYAKYVTRSRPQWHLCCNGDNGGWRTTVCDYLEHKWRYTKHYEKR
jgi:hypothetical protein